jgi:hypothetical protein
MQVIIIVNSNIRITTTKKYTTLQPKQFVIHLLLILVGVLIVGVIIFSEVLTSSSRITIAAANTEMTDMEFEDKAIKQELEETETKEIDLEEEEDNTAKQEEEEIQESNDYTAGTGLEGDNILGDGNYSSDGDVPFDLPFDNMVPFP